MPKSIAKKQRSGMQGSRDKAAEGQGRKPMEVFVRQEGRQAARVGLCLGLRLDAAGDRSEGSALGRCRVEPRLQACDPPHQEVKDGPSRKRSAKDVGMCLRGDQLPHNVPVGVELGGFGSSAE